MKTIQLFFAFTLILLLSSIGLDAQIAVTTDGSAPDNSAMLDVKSATKGFLPPRMTTFARTNIAIPATGLVVYDTDLNSLYLRTSTAWVPLSTVSSQWLTSGTNIYYSLGNVGVGTSSPTFKLDVNGTGQFAGALKIGAYTLPTVDGITGQVLKTNGTGTLAWSSDNGTSYTSGTGISIAGSTINSVWTASGNNVYNNNTGNIGIGTTAPFALLHVAEKNVLFSATGDVPVTPGNVPISGAGRRMMWYPDHAAFRAGYVNGTQWDVANVGSYSVAMGWGATSSGAGAIALGVSSNASGYASISLGWETTASGEGAIAFGESSTASGPGSTAFGVHSNASGSSSTSMGNYTTASGTASSAFGASTIASGYISTALGYGTVAKSSEEIVIGSLNTDYTPVSTTAWSASDRLFTIGNGAASNARSDAMVVLKNGNTGIGNSNPDTKLIVQSTGSEQLKLYNPTSTTGTQAGMYLQTASGWSVELRTKQDISYLELFGAGAVKHRWNDVNYYPGNSTAYFTGSGASLSLMDGNVGVGTLTPSKARLQVEGMVGHTTAIFSGSATSQGISMVADWPGVFFNCYSNGGTKTMAGSGYPSFFNTDQNNGGITINTTNIPNTAPDALITIPERFRITGDGKVGINNSNPEAELSVNGAESTVHGLNAAIRLTNTAPGGTSWTMRAGAIGTGTPRKGFSIADDQLYRMIIDSTGHFGIGTDTYTTNATLQVGLFTGAKLGIGSVEQIADGGNFNLSFNAELMPSSDNTYRIGNSTQRWTSVWAVDGTIQTSDAREKKEVADLEYGLETLMKMRPVTFKWNTGLDDAKHVGFIAQEMKDVVPEAIVDRELQNNEDGTSTIVPTKRLGMRYDAIIPVLVKSAQEQQKMIEAQQQVIFLLKAQNEQLISRIETLEKK